MSTTFVVGALVLGVAIAIPVPADSSAAWYPLAPRAALEPETFASIREAATAADLIVIGSAGGTTLTRVVGDGPEAMQFAEMEIISERFIKGSYRGARPRVIAIEYLVGRVGTEPSVGWPDARGLWLLREKRGKPDSMLFPAPIDESGLYRIVSSQGLIVDTQGRATAPLAEPGAFKVEVESLSFEEAVSRASNT